MHPTDDHPIRDPNIDFHHRLREARCAPPTHKIQHAGKSYPIISVEGFTDSPFFCGKEYVDSNSKPILREGAVYVRDPAAKTVLIAGPKHWDVILKRAVSHRQTELVDQLRSLLGGAERGYSVQGFRAKTENIRSPESRRTAPNARSFCTMVQFVVRVRQS